MGKKKGFSLIEVLIVVALVMILVMMISSTQDIAPRLNALVNNFISSLQQAKTIAGSENRLVAVQFVQDSYRERWRIEIRKQDLVGNLNLAQWEKVAEYDPPYVQDFFETGQVTDFVVGSLGDIRTLPILPNTQPTGIIETFRIKKSGKTFVSVIRIYPYGGYKIERRS